MPFGITDIGRLCWCPVPEITRLSLRSKWVAGSVGEASRFAVSSKSKAGLAAGPFSSQASRPPPVGCFSTLRDHYMREGTLDTLKETGGDIITPVSRERYIETFKWMLLARTVEEKLAGLWRAGKIAGGVYLGKGQEAISAAIGVMLEPGDIFGPLIRDQAGRLAFGEPLIDVFRVHFGCSTGLPRGRDGNVHRGNPRQGCYAMISHLGALISVVAGALVAKRFKGDALAIGATTIGDGGTSTGAFHEAINMAAIEKLPLVVVAANNQYAYSTPNSREFACSDLVDRAIGYGVEGHSMDGTDLHNCLEVISRATERARSGHGPQLVVGTCLRLSGHAEHDDGFYMDKSLYHKPLGRDCLKVAENYVRDRQWADEAVLETWKKTARQQVEEAAANAQREPLADPSTETWCPYATKRIARAVLVR
jgi:acetoin:2,6-dichlorophenolindophenol oxidoreductase subunit alpha